MTKPSSIDTLSEDEQFVLIEKGKAMERAGRHGEDARQPLQRLAAVEPHHQFLLLLRSQIKTDGVRDKKRQIDFQRPADWDRLA